MIFNVIEKQVGFLVLDGMVLEILHEWIEREIKINIDNSISDIDQIDLNSTLSC